MTTLTVENYLKATLQTTQKTGVDWVTTGQLATALSVSPGTVTSMMKTLAEAGHAEYRPYEGVCLTPAGRAVAMRMVRRHRLIELFLVKTLDLSWDQVHEEAENMEHAVSDALIDRIDEFLGRPASDPHGDPIPSADGELREQTDRAVTLDRGRWHADSHRARRRSGSRIPPISERRGRDLEIRRNRARELG